MLQADSSKDMFTIGLLLMKYRGSLIPSAALGSPLAGPCNFGNTGKGKFSMIKLLGYSLLAYLNVSEASVR